jgi:hypothetical protein
MMGRAEQLTLVVASSFATLVVVSTSSDFAPHGSHNPEHDSYDKQNHSQGPKDGNTQQEPEEKKYYTKSDHGCLPSR